MYTTYVLSKNKKKIKTIHPKISILQPLKSLHNACESLRKVMLIKQDVVKPIFFNVMLICSLLLKDYIFIFN